MATTKLGGALAGSLAKSGTASKFMAALSGKRPSRSITVPVLELPAQIVLLGTLRENDIEGEVLRAMDERGIPQDQLSVTNYELERAMRHLAEAVREPGELTGAQLPPALGTVEEWGCLPPAVVVDLYRTYNDLAEEHDPVKGGITVEERAAITDAVEKKSEALLRWFGVRRLASWLATTDVLLALSPMQKFEPGDSSSEP